MQFDNVWIPLYWIYNYSKSMAEENISQEFRSKNLDGTRNYLTEEIN